MTTTRQAGDPIGLRFLPPEVLLRIRSNIHSLESHVNFSLVCKTTYNLYDDAFWRFACIVSGWGMHNLLPKTQKRVEESRKTATVSLWAGLARVVVKDSIIFHVHKEIKNSAKEDTIFAADMASAKLAPADGQAAQTAKPSNKPYLNFQHDKKLENMFTVMPDDEAEEESKSTGAEWEWPGPKLAHHPFVGNRFLTKPHIANIVCDDGKTRTPLTIDNPEGITYRDAHMKLAAKYVRIPRAFNGDYTSHVFFEGFYGRGPVLEIAWGS